MCLRETKEKKIVKHVQEIRAKLKTVTVTGQSENRLIHLKNYVQNAPNVVHHLLVQKQKKMARQLM